MDGADGDPTGAAGRSEDERERRRRTVHESSATEVATAADGRPRTFPLRSFYDERRTPATASPCPSSTTGGPSRAPSRASFSRR